MPFIGNQPALSYTSFAKQDFTTSATTSYTLDNPVTNENELALFINFVRQEPTTAYTASGTTLTLTSATSATDDMYCVFLGKAVQTVNPPNGSVGTAQLADSSVSLAKLSATGTKDATTFLRGDNTFATAGGNNTPAFQARLTSNQSVSSSTQTTVAFNVVTGSEAFDSDSAFNTSTYKFVVPSGQGGKYFITSTLRLNESIPSDRCAVDIEVNGISAGVTGEIQGAHQFFTVTANAIFILSASDTVEIKFFQDSGVSKTIRNDASLFAGYKLIGV